MDSHYGVKDGTFYLYGVVPRINDYVKIQQHFVDLHATGRRIIPIGSNKKRSASCVPLLKANHCPKFLYSIQIEFD